MYERLVATIAARPDARVVHTRNGQVQQAYQAFLRTLR